MSNDYEVFWNTGTTARAPRRPLWARIVLSYSFGWFVAGELVGIALATLTLRIF